MKELTGLIKKVGRHYVSLCLELNVASQGESIEEARKMLQEACKEYLSYIKEKHLEKEIKPAPLETLREFKWGQVLRFAFLDCFGIKLLAMTGRAIPV